jgi:hypothetical protein
MPIVRHGVAEKAAKVKVARYFHIRCIVKTDRECAHERIHAIGGIGLNESRWTLTQDQAVSQIEEGLSAFYIETPRGKRIDIILAMDAHGNKYLKAAGDREQPEYLLHLPTCPMISTETLVLR